MDAIYLNANVVTMNPAQPEAAAFAVFNNRFYAVGDNQAVQALAGPSTRVVDLGGKTVIPGLIETHAHLSYYSLTLAMVDGSSASNESIQDVKDRLKAMAAETPAGGWITGWGYDDTLIAEKRHLTRQDLDEIAPNHPVLFLHVTGHLCYCNSLALDMAGVGPDTADPPGGTVHKDDKGVPTGLLMEPAAMNLVSEFRPVPDESMFRELIPKAAALYHQEGVTSVHDGAIGIIGEGPQVMKAYVGLAAEGKIRLRVYMTMVEYFYKSFLDQGLFRGFGSPHLKMGAIKNFQDGSIQALTAALREDYFNKAGFKGQLIMPQEELDAFAERYQAMGLQMAIHANGDAAIESVIQALEKAQSKHPRPDLRHMIIHCQMASEDHIGRMKKLGAIPSFFANHVYYWGDRHINLFLGEKRAGRIDPLASAVKAELPFTLHADTPVTPISPIFSMHNAVNRLTKDGVKLGADQCITPYQALEAYTTNAALCSFEENEKGSIEPGKLADFAVLSDDILAVEQERIKDIKILKTIVGGQLVYEASE
jgi:predicted amidohydrolase YtcJ